MSQKERVTSTEGKKIDSIGIGIDLGTVTNVQTIMLMFDLTRRIRASAS